MGFYENEFRAIIKLGILIGQVPLLLPNLSSIEDLKFKILSFTSVYYFGLSIVVLIQYMNEIWSVLSIARNFENLYKMFAKIITFHIVMRIKSILIGIEEFDEDLRQLRGKTPFSWRCQYRKISWIIIVIINIILSTLISMPIIEYKDLIYFVLLNSTKLFFISLYCILCITLARRQHYLSNECGLLFYNIKMLTYNGPDSVLPLLKIRHLHLRLISCCDMISDIFSLYNLINSFFVFFECTTIFIEVLIVTIEKVRVIPSVMAATYLSFPQALLYHVIVIAISDHLKSEVTKNFIFVYNC